MTIYQSRWRTIVLGLCILGLLPAIGEARDEFVDDRYNKSHKSQKPYTKNKARSERQNEKVDKRKSSGRQASEKNRSDVKQQKTSKGRHDQRVKSERLKSTDKHGSRSVNSRVSNNSHDTHYRAYITDRKRSINKSRHAYRHYETYRYHSHYLAPIRYHYHPLNFRVSVLPKYHTSLIVFGLPYFYYEGIFYQSHLSGYIVVRAPIGAHVRVLPRGFIAFSIGLFTYYYVNDIYYRWDDDHVRYVVVDKPEGADLAIDEATEGRLFSYPNKGQTEEQQTKDRYECHSWAVSESQVDPTMDEDAELSQQDKDNYKRAISACLQGRGYTVK